MTNIEVKTESIQVKNTLYNEGDIKVVTAIGGKMDIIKQVKAGLRTSFIYFLLID